MRQLAVAAGPFASPPSSIRLWICTTEFGCTPLRPPPPPSTSAPRAGRVQRTGTPTTPPCFRLKPPCTITPLPPPSIITTAPTLITATSLKKSSMGLSGASVGAPASRSPLPGGGGGGAPLVPPPPPPPPPAAAVAQELCREQERCNRHCHADCLQAAAEPALAGQQLGQPEEACWR